MCIYIKSGVRRIITYFRKDHLGTRSKTKFATVLPICHNYAHHASIIIQVQDIFEESNGFWLATSLAQSTLWNVT